MTQEQAMLIEDLLDYMWVDAQISWDEAGKPDKGHIFCKMIDLSKELEDFYLAEGVRGSVFINVVQDSLTRSKDHETI